MVLDDESHDLQSHQLGRQFNNKEVKLNNFQVNQAKQSGQIYNTHDGR